MLDYKMFIKLNKIKFSRRYFLKRFISKFQIFTLKLDRETFIYKRESSGMRIRKSPVDTIGNNGATEK